MINTIHDKNMVRTLKNEFDNVTSISIDNDPSTLTCSKCSSFTNIVCYKLPCGHSLCRNCMIDLNDYGKITCPTCETSVVVQNWKPEKPLKYDYST